jgi:hypothetical protein
MSDPSAKKRTLHPRADKSRMAGDRKSEKMVTRQRKEHGGFKLLLAKKYQKNIKKIKNCCSP